MHWNQCSLQKARLSSQHTRFRPSCTRCLPHLQMKLTHAVFSEGRRVPLAESPNSAGSTGGGLDTQDGLKSCVWGTSKKGTRRERVQDRHCVLYQFRAKRRVGASEEAVKKLVAELLRQDLHRILLFIGFHSVRIEDVGRVFQSWKSQC